ncbi:GDSL esterase/lipase 1 [Coffea arabica]|uniref:GDSL esterase/lipase 1 n=1 Tax=Coffea arabica TaxID=13443 RepID=A0A6P6WQK1_COFAR|nr:GDSL esterase/lipase 1-like [Coffea arabica]
MANLHIQLHLVALFFLSSLTLPSNCLPALHPKPPVALHPKSPVALIVFGDSLFDPGNNNYIKTTTTFQANFPPYGETYFKSPTGRFTNGRTIPDFIAEFAKLSLISPYLQTGHHEVLTKGVNFASGGAGALVETNKGSVISLHMQFNNFREANKQLRLKVGKRAARRVVKNAVYLISIGSNDYLNPLINNPSMFKSHAPQDFVAMVVGNITSVLKKIHREGGRKIGILTLGPLGCFPRLRLANVAAGGNGECLEQATALVKLHNPLLSQKLQLLQKQLKGFKYSYFDFFTVYTETIQNPPKYGFKEVKSACCGSGPFRGNFSCGGKRGVKEYELCHNPKDYLFFDAEHPSEAANFLSARLMWGGPSNVTGPYNIRSLFMR